MTELAEDPRTIIIYESPKRLGRTLRQLAEYFGDDRPAAVCREISKIHETINRKSLRELADEYSENQTKGEVVIIVGGCNVSESDTNTQNNNETL